MPAMDTDVASQQPLFSTAVQFGQDRKECIDNAPVWSVLTSTSIACHGISSLHQLILKTVNAKLTWCLAATIHNSQIRMVPCSLGANFSIMDDKSQSGIAMLAQIVAVGPGDVDVSF